MHAQLMFVFCNMFSYIIKFVQGLQMVLKIFKLKCICLAFDHFSNEIVYFLGTFQNTQNINISRFRDAVYKIMFTYERARVKYICRCTHILSRGKYLGEF